MLNKTSNNLSIDWKSTTNFERSFFDLNNIDGKRKRRKNTVKIITVKLFNWVHLSLPFFNYDNFISF